MLFEKLKSSSSRLNILSQCDILGSYDFFTTIVSFESLSVQDFKNMQEYTDSLQNTYSKKLNIEYDAYETLSRTLPLVTHEYTHFYDCSSTVWGSKYLSIMSHAYIADNLTYEGTEKDFHYAKKFHDLIRFSRLPEYYTDKTNVTDNSRPWKHHQSIGNRFSSSGEISDHPIMFTWFANSHGEQLVRSPISTISILECSAMAQEIIANVSLINLLEESQRRVELNLYTEKILDYVYNKDITEYSVCAHLMSNKFNEPDILLTYTASALLCRLVLNTPSKVYMKIFEECDFENIFGSDQGTVEVINKIKMGLKYLEPGFLYYLICYAMPFGKLDRSDYGFSLICAGLQKLGINYADLESESREEFLKYSDIAVNSKIDSISILAKAGKENYQSTDWSKPMIKFDRLSLPRALLGDSTEINIFSGDNNSLKAVSLDSIYDELIVGQIWVERFAEACA